MYAWSNAPWEFSVLCPRSQGLGMNMVTFSLCTQVFIVSLCGSLLRLRICHLIAQLCTLNGKSFIQTATNEITASNEVFSFHY